MAEIELKKAANKEKYLTELRSLPDQWGYKISAEREGNIYAGNELSVHEAVAWLIRPFVRGATAPEGHTLAGKPLGVHYFKSGLVPEAAQWDSNSGHTLIFVSHAWNVPLSFTILSVKAAVEAAGAVPSETFVWLDIFASALPIGCLPHPGFRTSFF